MQLNRDVGSTGEGSPQVGDEGVTNNSSAGLLPNPTIAPVSVPTDVTSSTPTPVIPLQAGLPHLTGLTAQNVESVKRAHELAAKMGFRQDPEFGTIINAFPGQILPDVTIQPKPSKAPVLRLDARGREIDEEGKVVDIPKAKSLSTLKVSNSCQLSIKTVSFLDSISLMKNGKINWRSPVLHWINSIVEFHLFFIFFCVTGEYQQTKEGCIPNPQT